jgi:hypothetical protein
VSTGAGTSGYVLTSNGAGALPSFQAGAGGGGSGTVTSVTATDTSIVVSGTDTIAPTLATGTLDVVAAQHPPAANWSNNSYKITSLAAGTASTDAAQYGQTLAATSGVSAASLGLGLLSMQPHATVGTSGAGETIPAQDIVFVLCTAVATQTVTHLGAFIQTAGATTGTGINAMALYSASGTLLENTSDMTSAFETANAYADAALTTSYSIVQGTNYYIAIIANFTGTTVKIAGNTALNSAITPINGNYLMCVLTGETSWPGSFTPSSATKDSNMILVYAR